MKITLKALRVLYGLSQKEAANLVGIYDKTWFNYENGKNIPDFDNVQKILDKFDVKLEDLAFENSMFKTHLDLTNKQQEN